MANVQKRDQSGLLLDNMEICLGEKTLLKISATIGAGETLTLMGPSGSGKSTLVAAIGGFLNPAFKCKGRMLLNGRSITSLPPDQRKVGVLFQDPLLFPHFSVIENLIFALPPGGSAKERRARAKALLLPVDLADLADRDPATLSGGQQARVALMRVIASEPEALLLDEPFSKLDAELRSSVREFVFKCAADQNLPTLLVTHDAADRDSAGGQVIVLG